jgi:ribosomal protein S12 methylthiotransferase accessory factor
MGITRVANVTGLDRLGIPVVMVTRPNARSIAVSQGKGLDLDAARASGVMESMESFLAEHIQLPLKWGTRDDLAVQHNVATVEDLPVSASARSMDDMRILWSESMELVSAEPVWIPFELVHTDYRRPAEAGSGYFLCSSNGLASGNTYLEAVVHGACEVIERDANALWNRLTPEQRAATGVDPDSVSHGECRDLLRRYEEAAVDVAIWDMTTDIGLPAFYCQIHGRQRHDSHSGAGAGCHLTRDVALLRALTEAAQVRTTYIAGSRDDLSARDYSGVSRRRKDEHSRRLIAQHTPARDFHGAPDWQTSSFAADIKVIVERLGNIGIYSLFVTDLSRPPFPVHAVKVVVPAIEAVDEHPQYRPGRRARNAAYHMGLTR